MYNLMSYFSLHKLRPLRYSLCFGKSSFHACIYKQIIFSARYMTYGKGCLFFPGSRIECVLIKKANITPPHLPLIEFGEGVAIGQNCHITCGDSIKIGAGTAITAMVTITDISHPYKDLSVSPKNAQLETSPVIIGKDCFIANGAVILPGVKIGNHCVVGANSVVCAGTFPDNCIIAGIPARIIKKYNPTTKEWEKIKSL